MGKPIPLGRDVEARNFAALVAAIESAGIFGKPEIQHTSDGVERIVHCPLCIADGKGDGHRKHLRIAKRAGGGPLPYVGCRIHDEPGDWGRIRSALVSAGVPADLLTAGGTGGSGSENAGATNSAPRKESVQFKEADGGLGESDPIPPGDVDKWVENLWGPKGKKYLDFLVDERGLDESTIKEARIGIGGFRWSPGKRRSTRITIPIFDVDGNCVNVRLYSAQPGNGPKMLPYPHPKRLNDAGERYLTYARPTRLYGVQELAYDTGVNLPDIDAGESEAVEYVVVCAGEWDRLLLVQEGLLTVTGTGAEKTLPRKEDCEYLAGRDVVIIYDCDKSGRLGSAKFARAALAIGAKSVRVVDLDADRDDGYDVSDFILGSDSESPIDDLLDLIEDTDPYESSGEGEDEPEEIPYSDTDVARLLLRRHKGDVHFVDTGPTSGYWVVWDGQRWQRDVDGLRERWIVDVGEEFLPSAKAAYYDAVSAGEGVAYASDVMRRVKALSNNARIKAASDRLKSVEAGITIVPEDLDNQQSLLGVENGTLHLTSQGAVLKAASRKQWLTMNTGVPFVKDAKSPAWNSFLQTFIPDKKLQEFLGRMTGYMLLGGNPDGMLFTLDGATRTGKSTFLNAISYALGDYACPFDLTAFRGKFDVGPREDVASIMTARVAYVSEVNGAFELHADQIKRLTGSDKISFNKKYEHQQSRHADFTPLIAANGKPRIKGADRALHGRICTIPFLVSMPERSRKAEALRDPEVATAVLAWAVAGYDRYCVEGIQADTWPGSVAEATLGTLAALDDIDEFIADCCEVDAGYSAFSRDFYPVYRGWCSENGIKQNDVLPKQMLGESLTDRGYKQKTKWVDGKNQKIRLGIKLRDEMSGISFGE